MKTSEKIQWSQDLRSTVKAPQSALAKLSLKVRAQQLKLMMSAFQPKSNTSVLDVGFANDLDGSLPDTNFFEKFYPYKNQITAAGVEDCSTIVAKYPGVKIVRIQPGQALPFRDGEFDLVTSWATLEHVGDYEAQDFFLSELRRVGKQVFVTVPYRGCIYEPHAGTFFLHWLPLKQFRSFCRSTGREAWADPVNLNPLYVSDIKKFKSARHYDIDVFCMYGVLPSHLILKSKN